jgi:hypothetical protein
MSMVRNLISNDAWTASKPKWTISRLRSTCEGSAVVPARLEPMVDSTNNFVAVVQRSLGRERDPRIGIGRKAAKGLGAGAGSRQRQLSVPSPQPSQP